MAAGAVCENETIVAISGGDRGTDNRSVISGRELMKGRRIIRLGTCM